MIFDPEQTVRTFCSAPECRSGTEQRTSEERDRIVSEPPLEVNIIRRGGFISGINDALDDKPACISELIRKFTQIESSLVEPQAIELHKLRLVDLDSDPGPEGIDIVRFPIQRHGNRHDRVR
jgi:hypothetical protein